MDIDRVRGVIAQMKLQEKLALVGGETVTPAVSRLNVPGMDLGDTVMPYHVEEPTALALGCTFSQSLCTAVAKMRAAKAAGEHKAVAGTIGCGLMTEPMRPDACDLFSEDAFVTAELLSAYSSAAKPGYVFTNALGQGTYMNRTVDSRALHELYLYPLERAGKYAAALQLDGGYLNGMQVSTSRAVCDMLAANIPPTATVLTQYGCGGGAGGVAGSGAYQLGMSSADKKAVSRAVVNGTLYENKLNNSVERVVATAADVYEFYKNNAAAPYVPVNVMVDSTVLLKNDGLLPAKQAKLTLFGDAAAFDDGEIVHMLPIKDAPKKYGSLNVFFVTDHNNGIDNATSSAICAVAAAAPTVVVLCGGAAAELTVEKSVNAVLFCPYCPTVAVVLAMLTNTSPRGHLPFTWLRSRKAYPRNNSKYSDRGDFRYESLYNGYRLFNNFKSDVLYPFGHGLDYATYEVSKLAVSCDNLRLGVDFVIKNSGGFAGSALCQVYATPTDSPVYGLNKRLVAFKRIALEATENAHVRFDIDLNDFKVYDDENNTYSAVGGRYRIDVGLSSLDIRASAEIKVPVGSRVKAGLGDSLAPAYYRAGKGEGFDPTAPEIERLLKVPFIKKPDEYQDILPPEPAKYKGTLKHAEKTVHSRLLPLVRYKIQTTPIN